MQFVHPDLFQSRRPRARRQGKGNDRLARDVSISGPGLQPPSATRYPRRCFSAQRVSCSRAGSKGRLESVSV
jgi:hypothetical protein